MVACPSESNILIPGHHVPLPPPYWTQGSGSGMKDKIIHVSLREDIVNKASPEQMSLTGVGWKNQEISVEKFIDHIERGHPFAHQFFDGQRKKAFFQCASILVADIDQGLTLDQALEHDLVKGFATFIYTTPTHTLEENRFRIVFVLERRVFDPDHYEAMYADLMTYVPTDPKAKSCAQFFFGSQGTQTIWLGNILSGSMMNTMITDGLKKKYDESQPLVAEVISENTMVKVKNRGLRPLTTLPAKTSIHCPFGTHPDHNPSAFVVISQDGIHGVQCTSCGKKAFISRKPYNEQSFGVFDRLVKKYAGVRNSHFEYSGLTALDHDIETSMGVSNYHLYDDPHCQIKQLVEGIHLIKSPKGTGKTHMLAELVQTLKNPQIRNQYKLRETDRTILIGHRQSLIRESAEKLGLECYLNTGETDWQVKYISKWVDGSLKTVGTKTLKPQYYAICLDSLKSRVRPQHERYGVVIIDESEQVFSHFLSQHMEHPTTNFLILSKLIRQAKFVFCLDADLDHITLAGITACLSYAPGEVSRMSSSDHDDRRLQKVYCHLNTYRPPSRVIDIFSSKPDLLDDLKRSLMQGKRCYVTSNSKKFVEGLYEAFSKAFKKKTFRLVVSDLGDDEDNRAFLMDVRTRILDYDCVMCSPSIGTGIDITFPQNAQEIDVVYGFFEVDVNTHFDIDQQLGRVRHPGKVKVWINPKRQRLSLTAEKIHQELVGSDEVKGLSYFLDTEGVHAGKGSHPLMDLLTQVIITRRRSMNDLRSNFIVHKQNTGWIVNEIHKDVARAERGKVINKASLKSRKNAVTTRLTQAPDLGFKEFTRLRDAKDRQEALTDVEKASLTKYRLARFYCQEVTEELVAFDNDGKMRGRIRLFELVTDPSIKHVDYRQINQDVLLRLEFKKKLNERTLRQVVFLREVFSMVGLFDMGTFRFDLSVTYGNENLKDFIAFVRRYRERYLQAFDKDIHEHLDERPVSQVRTMLSYIGLTGRVVRKNKGKDSGPARYQIDPKRFALVQGIVDARLASSLKTESDPNIDTNISSEIEQEGDPDIGVDQLLKSLDGDPGV